MKPGSKNEFPHTPARLVDSSKDPYVIYYVWSVQEKRKVRKRYSLQGNSVAEKRKDAVDAIKEINRRLKDGWHIDEALPVPVEEPVPVIPTKAFTFEDAYQYYRQTKKTEFRENTDGLNEHYFRHFRTFLDQKKRADIPLKDIKSTLMFEFFDTAAVGGRFRNNMLGHFKSFFTFFIDRELLPVKNPCSAIKKVRVDASEDHRPFNAQQAKDIRAAILDRGDEQLWLFLQFIYFLFVRPGEELRYLRVGDILSDQIRIESGTAKNRKTGFVDIPTALEQLIQKNNLRNYPATHYVFTIDGHPGPQHVGENYFYKRHRKIMEQLDLFGHDYDVYSWKPTGAIVLYKATKDIMLVQRHCRHSTPDQTYTYLRKHGLVFEGQRVTEFPQLWE